MMYQIVTLVVCALSAVQGGWLQELTRGRGLEFGNGISLHLDRLKRDNASSLLERHALRVDYAGMGLSVGKASSKDALHFGLYARDEVEGRGRKVGEVLVPAIIGFKAAGIGILMFTVATVLVFKALALAKLAALVSVGMLIAKHLHFQPNPYMEIEHLPSHHPMHAAEYPSATGYSPSGSSNYLAYANYAPSGMQGSENVGQYTIMETATGNSSATTIPASKRRDFLLRRKQSEPVPILTVRKYTIEH